MKKVRIIMKNSRICTVAAIIAVALMLTLCGCGGRQAVNAPQMRIDIVNGQKIYTGTEKRTYRVEENSQGDLKISITRDSGKIDVLIYPTDDEANYCYKGTDITSSDFSVKLPNSGEYTVLIEADGFCGEYAVDFCTQSGNSALNYDESECDRLTFSAVCSKIMQ